MQGDKRKVYAAEFILHMALPTLTVHYWTIPFANDVDNDHGCFGAYLPFCESFSGRSGAICADSRMALLSDLDVLVWARTRLVEEYGPEHGIILQMSYWTAPLSVNSRRNLYESQQREYPRGTIKIGGKDVIDIGDSTDEEDWLADGCSKICVH